MNEEVKKYNISLIEQLLLYKLPIIAPILILLYSVDFNILSILGFDNENVELAQSFLFTFTLVYAFIIIQVIYDSTRYFIVTGDRLQYFTFRILKYDFPLNEIKIKYRYIYRRRHYNFYIFIKHNNKIRKIKCNHLEYETLYNDLMNLQGKEPVDFSLEHKTVPK